MHSPINSENRRGPQTYSCPRINDHLVRTYFTDVGPNQLWHTDMIGPYSREGTPFAHLANKVISKRIAGYSFPGRITETLVDPPPAPQFSGAAR